MKLCFFALFLFVAPCFAGTYYIDFGTGSDSNNGSKAFPWKHHPFMAGWTGTYSHVAGDKFFFKGGITWDRTCFPLTNSKNGSPGQIDYFGAETDTNGKITWYTGSAPAKPIFDNGGVSGTKFILAGNYWQIDNIEFRGYFWNKASSGYGNCTMISLYPASNTTVSNCYFHGWSHDTYANGTPDSLYIILGSTAGTTTSNIITGCTFDGTDTDAASGMAALACATIRNCTVTNMSNGFLTNEATEEVSGCTIGPIHASFDPTNHENAIEENGAGAITTTMRVFNNVIHDTYGVTCLFGPANGTGSGWKVFVYNNVVWNSSPIIFQFDSRSLTASSAYLWNNTVDTSKSPAVVSVTGSNWGSIVIKNNHVIGTAPLTYNTGATLVTSANNISQTLSIATVQGYTAVEVDPYSPTGTTGATYSAGVPDTDTGSAADILGNGRPQAGSRWDAGAYEYASGSNTPPGLGLPPITQQNSN